MNSRAAAAAGQRARLFVPLQRLRQDLDLAGRVNTLLVADRDRPGPRSNAALEASIRQRFALADVGLTIRPVAGGAAIAVESAAGFIDAARATAVDSAAAGAGLKARPVLTYLANSMRSGDRQVPYSLVTALDLWPSWTWMSRGRWIPRPSRTRHR